MCFFWTVSWMIICLHFCVFIFLCLFLFFLLMIFFYDPFILFLKNCSFHALCPQDLTVLHLMGPGWRPYLQMAVGLWLVHSAALDGFWDMFVSCFSIFF